MRIGSYFNCKIHDLYKIANLHFFISYFTSTSISKNAIGFVGIFDSKDEAWVYARKLYPEIDLTQATTEKYYSKYPEAKEIIK